MYSAVALRSAPGPHCACIAAWIWATEARFRPAGAEGVAAQLTALSDLRTQLELQALTNASGWASLVAALAIGTVSTIMLLRFRVTKQPTWVYGLGLAAGIIVLAVIPLLLLGEGFTPVDAVLGVWLPLALQGTGLGAGYLLLWQASGIATVLWTAMCAIGMSPAVQKTRSSNTARLAGAY